jgi:RNA polymerase sigma-70 factor, ECF subfamily
MGDPHRDEASGSNAAAALAFEQFGGRVYRFLLRKSRNHHDAEDLTQRVFLEATEALRHADVEPTSMLAWLFTIARRRFIDELRRRERADQITQLVPGTSLDEAYGNEIAGALREGIKRLPSEQQLVLVMKVIQGRSYTEIAEELGITIEACRMRLSRAVAALRADLERDGLRPDGR